MTINGYRCAETIDERGPIATGLAADMIAVSEIPWTTSTPFATCAS